MDSQKRKMYLLMTVLMFAWGLEYIFAKQALTVIEPLTLVFFKYGIGFLVVLVIKFKFEGKGFMRKKDIPLFIFCAIFGEIGYFYLEYTAMDFLPVSLITIVLALVPALSIIIDKVIFKKKSTKKMAAGVIFCILGIILVIGVDYQILFQGRIIGYLLAFGAVVSWNFYNFLTASLHERYDSATLTVNQLICTILLIWPYALTHLPNPETISMGVVGGILYLGTLSTGFGFMVQVRSLHILGPTITAIFSNFLAVTTTLFGWLILKETISLPQIIGGVIVIAAGYIVIREKGRVEDLSHD
ncbi:MAG: DMT family transporter [Bacillota bacterium]